jgi:hypothetical protein
MGTRFTHFNPLSDENGLGLQERFHERVNNSIKVETDNVYCIFIGDDDKCHKYNINNTKAAELIKDYTPLKLFKYIFGDVFKRYVDNPSYKNMSEEDLLQICADFAEHLKTSGNVLIKDAEDVERERFSAKYPNNAYAKYADPTKVYFSRIIDPDTRKTLYFYFPILLEEDETQYHIILKYNESRQIGIQTFNPFDNDCMMDDMGTFANAILTDLDNSCIMHIRETKISIEFVKDKTEFSYSDNKVDFYRMFFSRMYEYLVSDYRLSETELKQVCDDFESYLNYFKTTEFAETEDINSDKYAFHTLCQNNAFSKRISEATISEATVSEATISEATVSEATIRKAKQIYIPKYMYKVRDIKNKKIVKWHYLPLAVVSNDKTYNALISMD